MKPKNIKFSYLILLNIFAYLLPVVLLMGCKPKHLSIQPNHDLKVVTYNVWVGYQDRKHPRLPCLEIGSERKSSIYEWLKEQEADVVVFQELMDYSAEKLKNESKFWDHNYAVTLRDQGMAIGISSRYPIKVKEILTEGMQHGLIYCTINGVDIIATHLWPSFDHTILDEVNIVKERVDSSLKMGHPLLLLGDFNAFSPEDELFISDETMDLYKLWGWGLVDGRPNYQVIQALLNSGIKDVCTKFRKNDKARKQRYDFIFASPNLWNKCTDANHFQEAEFLRFSDHYPVTATFSNIKN